MTGHLLHDAGPDGPLRALEWALRGPVDGAVDAGSLRLVLVPGLQRKKLLMLRYNSKPAIYRA